MCPSYRVTRDEQHLTRGRANTLRLALSGQLGEDALTSDAMRETMQLCVGCKGCKRECPTGVDMARMKIEFLYHFAKRHGLSLHDRLVAYLPRYAPVGGPVERPRQPARPRARAGDSCPKSSPGSAGSAACLSGAAIFSGPVRHRTRPEGKPEVVLFADTFNTYFEPENARAAQRVLDAAGYRVHVARPNDGPRPLCCGRTFLAAGLVDEAKLEARRMLDALKPFVERGVPIVGLEPSCLFTLRDEFPAMLPGGETAALSANAVPVRGIPCREADRDA